jgi:hypothetical protein
MQGSEHEISGEHDAPAGAHAERDELDLGA